MSLKSMIKSLTIKGNNADIIRKNDVVQALIASENFPIIRVAETDMSKYRKVPVMGLAALGTAFAMLPESARTIVQSVTTSIATNETLFVGISPRAIMPGDYLIDKGMGTVGNIMRVNEQGKQVIAGRMRFKPLEGGLPVTQTTTTTVPFDPTSLMIAAALMEINAKLDTLQKTAEEILQFLKLEKQSKQRGNLNALGEILEEYKRNCNDDKLCGLRNVDVQTIRREAQQDILFYQEQIAKQLHAQKTFHGSQQARNMLDAVKNEFYEYQLACYIYAFATFLDVLLRKDFDSESLSAVIAKMSEHADRYSSLYVECHAQIANYQHTSIEAQVLGGIGNAAKAVGRKLSEIPVLNKGIVDEALIGAGESIGNRNRAVVAKHMDMFAPLEDHRMTAFIQNIRTMDLLYNHPNGMLTDGENLYLLETA